jgi:uncharacterized protein
MLERTRHLQAVRRLLKNFPVVAVIGPRQVGKSTLARQLAGPKSSARYFDLENPVDLGRLADPMLALERLTGLVVIDEVQRSPELFQILRVLADRRPLRARFLVLGSAAPELLRQTSESLAGRIVYYELSGFALDEVGPARLEKLWLRGGFPDSFLARSGADSFNWRRQFVRTYLERDLPSLGVRFSSVTLERFWTMVAHFHGQLWNASEFGRSLGVADTTVRGYLDTLASAFVLTILRPWHENVGKRQVKSPRIYVSDPGLLHALLDIRDRETLERHPKSGASWEGFMIQQVYAHLGVDARDGYFWRTANGAELDLLIARGSKRVGFEIKRTTAPSLTPSMRAAFADLKLQRLYVLYVGEHTFDLAPGIQAVPASQLLTLEVPGF